MTRQFNHVVATGGDAVVLTEHDDHRWVHGADLVDLNVSDQIRAILESF